MSYCLKGDESVGDGIRRIVRQEIGSAIDRLEDDEMSLDKTAHEVRKHCKKIRGALRLIRFSFPDYGNENTRFRHLAGELSGIRDAYVMQITHRNLVQHVSRHATEPSVATLNRSIELHAESVSRNLAESLETVRVGLNAACQDIDEWIIVGSGFEAVAGGLRFSYKRARKGLSRCRKGIDAGNFHDWRKRVKYHWCHMRLLNNVWPKGTYARAVSADRLSDILGDDHDIAVYLGFLGGVGDEDAAGAATAIRQYAEERRAALQKQSLAIGARLFAEKANRFAERFA